MRAFRGLCNRVTMERRVRTRGLRMARTGLGNGRSGQDRGEIQRMKVPKRTRSVWASVAVIMSVLLVIWAPLNLRGSFAGPGFALDKPAVAVYTGAPGTAQDV